MNLTRHSKETVSKALLFTADSDFCTPDAKSSSPTIPQTTSTPSAMTSARLRAMLKERAELTSKSSPNSVAMPIDERESASLMQFASQLPGWIPIESLASPDLSKFTELNRTFAEISQSDCSPKEQHTLNRKSYSCQICQKTFVHSTNLTRHMRTAHGQQVRHQRRAISQDDSLTQIADSGTTSRTSEIISSAMRDNRELVEKAATIAETPRRHSASDAEAAQILSSMRELVVR